MLLKADQPSDKSYWISVGSQYRKGAPSGYGVLKYSTGGGSNPDPANIVTPGAVADKKWKTDGALSGGSGSQYMARQRGSPRVLCVVVRQRVWQLTCHDLTACLIVCFAA